MPTLTHTYTKTYTVTEFADPYKQCCRCGLWVDGALDKPGPLTVVPCEHTDGYDDICPSWSPVDGCTCPPGTHEMRPPSDDGKVY